METNQGQEGNYGQRGWNRRTCDSWHIKKQPSLGSAHCHHFQGHSCAAAFFFCFIFIFHPSSSFLSCFYFFFFSSSPSPPSSHPSTSSCGWGLSFLSSSIILFLILHILLLLLLNSVEQTCLTLCDMEDVVRGVQFLRDFCCTLASLLTGVCVCGSGFCVCVCVCVRGDPWQQLTASASIFEERADGHAAPSPFSPPLSLSLPDRCTVNRFGHYTRSLQRRVTLTAERQPRTFLC